MSPARVVSALALAAALLLSGCGWAQYRFGADHSGANPTESGITGANVGSLVPHWTANIGAASIAPPVTSGGVVYIAALDGRLRAYSVECARNGGFCTPLWVGVTGAVISTAPAVADGKVFVGSEDGRLSAYPVGCGTGGATCAPAWTANLGAPIKSSPAVADGVVYVGNVYAFAENCGTGGATCTPLWKGNSAHTDSIGSPTVSGGRVYSYDQNGLNVYPVGCGTGGAECFPPVWTARPGGVGGHVTAVAADGRVYLPNYFGQTYGYPTSCHAGAACDPVWTGSPTDDTHTLAVTDGHALGTTSNGIFDVSTSCGTGTTQCSPVWRGQAPLVTGPSVAGDVVYAGGSDGKLYAWSRSACKAGAAAAPCAPALAKVVSPNELTFDPVIADGEVYVGTTDGFLYDYHLPPPPASAARHISGRGTRELGSFTVRGPSTLTWSSPGGAPRVSATVGGHRFVLRAPSRRGRHALPAGRYRHVRISARGRWSVRIR